MGEIEGVEDVGETVGERVGTEREGPTVGDVVGADDMGEQVSPNWMAIQTPGQLLAQNPPEKSAAQRSLSTARVSLSAPSVKH